MSESPSSWKEPIKLAVIVLNYRTPAMVVDCLESLEGQITPPEQRVVVVDNHSGDDSADRIEAEIGRRGWGDWARVERSPVNGGFAAGNNVGIRSIDAGVYLLLNSDTIVRKGAIETIIQTLDQHPEVHMLGPQLEWMDGKHQISTFRYRTPITELLYASSLGLLARLFPRHVVARELHEWTVGIDWVSFACIAIRREVIEKIGLLDEGYFMYFEDMAYCRKATGSGFTIAYQPEAHVVHLRGGSSPVKEATRQKKRRPLYFSNARSHYFRSFYGLPGHIVANLFWMIGYLIGSLRGRSGAVQKEWRDIWVSPRHSMGDQA
ncbi:MAG: family 2 glycosyl transferase [Phycisphaerae bacterium]|nr:family 2 glycosyl transferase [Phycisphaerae bacterium]MBM92669.1 family 2 glycosyl transferase [Phycisphaerae bacterium]HCT44892.1 glycosyltransferase family 2 protein [Phycisphaerales bacterium]